LEKVIVLGASPKPGRYAYQALVKLQAAGHDVIPVHPKVEQIEGIRVIASLTDISTEIDTITLYVGPDRMQSMVDAVCALKPKRVIFNPGTESESIENTFEEHGIQCVRDCTLIMLDQGRY